MQKTPNYLVHEPVSESVAVLRHQSENNFAKRLAIGRRQSVKTAHNPSPRYGGFYATNNLVTETKSERERRRLAYR